MGMLDRIKEKIAETVYPRRCPLCGAVINSNERICSRCSKDIEFIRRPICRICGRPLYSCHCRKGDYVFVRNVSPLVYTKSAKKGIHRMKFNNSPYSCTYFGKLMANVVRSEYLDCGVRFDCVIGVPMFREDFLTRGYNQAVLLAKTVSEDLELPLLSKVLIKNYSLLNKLSRWSCQRVSTFSAISGAIITPALPFDQVISGIASMRTSVFRILSEVGLITESHSIFM